LQVHFRPEWIALADVGAEEALHDIAFAGIDPGTLPP
jgi:hypothetical protein